MCTYTNNGQCAHPATCGIPCNGDHPHCLYHLITTKRPKKK